MNEMIVSIYDGCYQCSVLVNEKITYGFESEKALQTCVALNNLGNKNEVLGIMNEYNVSKIILCDCGGIIVFERKGDEICIV